MIVVVTDATGEWATYETTAEAAQVMGLDEADLRWSLEEEGECGGEAHIAWEVPDDETDEEISRQVDARLRGE